MNLGPAPDGQPPERMEEGAGELGGRIATVLKPRASAGAMPASPLTSPAACRCRGIGFWYRACLPLSAADLAWADAIAGNRLEEAIRAGGRDRLGYNSLRSHELGARGELAFCRLLGIEWPARVNTFHALPDVDPDYEIRTAVKRYLKIRPAETAGDLAARRFVLVTADGAWHTVWGYVYGAEAYGAPVSDPGGLGKPAHFLRPADIHRLPFHVTSKREKEDAKPAG